MSSGTQNFLFAAAILAALAAAAITRFIPDPYTPGQKGLALRLHTVGEALPLDEDVVVSAHALTWGDAADEEDTTFIYVRASLECRDPDKIGPDVKPEVEFNCGEARFEATRGLVSTGTLAAGCTELLKHWRKRPPHFQGCTKKPAISAFFEAFRCPHWCDQGWIEDDEACRARCPSASDED